MHDKTTAASQRTGLRQRAPAAFMLAGLMLLTALILVAAPAAHAVL